MIARIKPLIKWPGGKSRMLKHLLPLLPPHKCYVEPFAGGLALLLAKPPSKIEVINDLNGDLVTLYRIVKYHAGELRRELRGELYARQVLADYLAQPGLTDIQRAARFFWRNRLSFSANGRSFGLSKCKNAAVTAFNALRFIAPLHHRLQRVLIESNPYERVLRNYDGPDTCFFLDPPYVGADARIYATWTQADVRALAGRLSRLKGQWILTINDSAFCRRLFRNYKIRSVITRNCAEQSRDRATFGELIVTAR